MLRLVTIAAVAAVIAGAIVALPDVIPAVEASTPAPSHKGNRLDMAPEPAPCIARGWPYYDHACKRSDRAGARIVRVVTTDRI